MRMKERERERRSEEVDVGKLVCVASSSFAPNGRRKSKVVPVFMMGYRASA